MQSPPRGYKTPIVLAGLFAGISALFWWTFYERYVKYEDRISQLTNSSCITPDGGNVTQAGIYWGLLAMLFACVALIFVLVLAFRFLRNQWRAR